MKPKPPPRVFELRVTRRNAGPRTLHRFAPSEQAACLAARMLPSTASVLFCEPLSPSEARKVLGLSKGGPR